MIDIHSHIIHNIDDGSRSLEESLAILKNMKKIGFDIVVATPHYIAGTSFVADNKAKSTHLKQIYVWGMKYLSIMIFPNI